VDINICPFSISELVRDEWEASRSDFFTLGIRVTGTYSIGGLVAFSYVLDVTGTEKSLAPVVKNSSISVVELIAKAGTNRSREIF